MRRPYQLLAATALAAIAALPAAAKECQAPGPAPAIPDGTTATADQMKAARDGVQSYVNVLQDYQDCLELNIKNAPRGTKAEDLQRQRDKGNAAIDQATALKNTYIAQVKAFKARQPPAK